MKSCDAALTAYCSAVQEGSHDVRIHVDSQVLLLNNLLVSLPDLLLDPRGKRLPCACVDDVRQELLRQLLDLLLYREVLEAGRVLVHEDLHLLDGEVLVLRDCQMLDLIRLEELLLTIN